MNLQEFWAKARPAVRYEVLKLAGVPAPYLNELAYSNWNELPVLSVVALERSWDAPVMKAIAGVLA